MEIIASQQTNLKKCLVTLIQIFVYRKYIEEKNWPDEKIEKYVEKLVEEESENGFFTLNLDGKVINIVFILLSVTGLNKVPELTDFMEKFKKNHKIIIVSSITDKAKSTIIKTSSSGGHTEIFVENDLLVNVLRYDCSPLRYEILSNEEAEEVKKKYLVDNMTLPGITSQDIVASFLNLKPNDIVRIIRGSELSCKAIAYRIYRKNY